MSLALVASRREELATVLSRGAWRPWRQRSEGVWRQRRAPEGALAYQRRDHSVSMILTGAGRAQTEKAMAWLLETERPDSILSLGFAGACTPNLDIGDLVLATRLNHIEGSPFDWDPESLNPTDLQSGGSQLDVTHEEILADAKMLDMVRGAVEINGIDFMPSTTLTVNSLVRTTGLSEWLGETYGISAVDRESYWVAAAAGRAGVPCLSVRAIVYGVDETLPEIASRLPDTPSGGRLGPIFKYGVRHPRKMWRYMRAVRSARNAVATLMAVLTNSDIFNVGKNP